MRVLISTVSYEEAASILDTGVDIINMVNVNEGSLGAQFPWRTREVVELARRAGIKASATLGDLPYKPGTAALAALGAAHSDVAYVKAGLYGLTSYEEASDMMKAVRRAVRMLSDEVQVIAAGYADHRRFVGLDTRDLLRAAQDAECDAVMIDTAVKDGRTLFDALSFDRIRTFVEQGKEAGLTVALGGSLTLEHGDRLFDLDPDIIAVRGAVCEGRDRKTRISPEKTRAFVEFFHHQLQPTNRAGARERSPARWAED